MEIPLWSTNYKIRGWSSSLVFLNFSCQNFLDKREIFQDFHRNFAEKSAHFIQNLHWKLGQQAPSVGTILVYLETISYMYFFRNKTFLFFKIESWNFQHLFEKEFCETSQNFNSIRQPIEKMKITIVWMSWNFVRFHEVLFWTDAESFSILSWKTKKFYS